ncbi:MAG: hypothetical protein NTU47_02390 [Ignavibacteriales bacterium]|nr:hypothetical protein [Ignavibacteriales bacterium]
MSKFHPFQSGIDCIQIELVRIEIAGPFQQIAFIGGLRAREGRQKHLVTRYSPAILRGAPIECIPIYNTPKKSFGINRDPEGRVQGKPRHSFDSLHSLRTSG